MSADSRLVFVYNADSGVLNAVKDFFHKALRPSTYQCNLCAVTFGPLGMKSTWKEYVNDLDVEAEFLHRDEFRERFPGVDAEFPSAYLVTDGHPRALITKAEMESAGNIDDMMALVSEKLDVRRAGSSPAAKGGSSST